jgi:small-conductance mechanosensitive channel
MRAVKNLLTIKTHHLFGERFRNHFCKRRRIQMGLFREPLRDILARVEAAESAARAEAAESAASAEAAESSNENVIPLQSKTSQRPMGAGADIVNLVHRAAEAIKSRENQIVERDAKTRALSQRAADELRLAKEQAQMTGARIMELEDLVKQQESVIAAIQSRLLATENDARAAEARAEQAEYALTSVEEAIRTKLLAADIETPGNFDAA